MLQSFLKAPRAPLSLPTRSRQHSTSLTRSLWTLATSVQELPDRAGGNSSHRESQLSPSPRSTAGSASSSGLLSKLPDGLLRPADSRLHRAHYVATTPSNLINYLSIYLPIYLSLLIILFTTPVPSCKIYPKSHSQVILLFKNTSCLTQNVGLLRRLFPVSSVCSVV